MFFDDNRFQMKTIKLFKTIILHLKQYKTLCIMEKDMNF